MLLIVLIIWCVQNIFLNFNWKIYVLKIICTIFSYTQYLVRVFFKQCTLYGSAGLVMIFNCRCFSLSFYIIKSLLCKWKGSHTRVKTCRSTTHTRASSNWSRMTDGCGMPTMVPTSLIHCNQIKDYFSLETDIKTDPQKWQIG